MAQTIFELFNAQGNLLSPTIKLDVINQLGAVVQSALSTGGIITVVMPTADQSVTLKFTNQSTGGAFTMVPNVKPAAAATCRYRLNLPF